MARWCDDGNKMKLTNTFIRKLCLYSHIMNTHTSTHHRIYSTRILVVTNRVRSEVLVQGIRININTSHSHSLISSYTTPTYPHPQPPASTLGIGKHTHTLHSGKGWKKNDGLMLSKTKDMCLYFMEDALGYILIRRMKYKWDLHKQEIRCFFSSSSRLSLIYIFIFNFSPIRVFHPAQKAE